MLSQNVLKFEITVYIPNTKNKLENFIMGIQFDNK